MWKCATFKFWVRYETGHKCGMRKGHGMRFHYLKCIVVWGGVRTGSVKVTCTLFNLDLTWPKFIPVYVPNSESEYHYLSSYHMWRPSQKTDLKVFVVVLPKEGWAHVDEHILIWVWHRLLKNTIYEVKRVNSKKSVSYQKMDGRGHAHASFFGYDNDKDLNVFFLVTHLIPINKFLFW